MLKILVAQLNPTIGDIKGNFFKVKEIWNKYQSAHDLIVFPELTLTGYPPNDLLLRRGFIEKQLDYLEEVKKLTAESECHILIGAVVKNTDVGKPLRNAALGYGRGVEQFRYYKQLLPTYNVFDENRYFEAGNEKQDNRWMITNKDFSRFHVVGVLICEDCWNDEAICDAPLYPTNPVKNSFRYKDINSLQDVVEEKEIYGKPEVMITINASPSDIGKHHTRYSMYTTLSRKYSVPFLYVNSVGGQDSLIFDGHSFLVNKNKLIYGHGFKEHCWTVNLFNDKVSNAIPIHTPMLYNEPLIIEHLKLGIKDYVEKNGFKKVVIGSSGGIDSAVTLMLAVEALGAENVYAVTMPSKYSSLGSVDDSIELCEKFGVKLYNRPIKKDTLLAIEEYENTFGGKPKRLTIENMQARIRGRILMEFSNDTGALVLSTGNKSEMSVGYCTLYGDMCGGLSVIADLYKTEVYAIAKYYNEQKGDYFIPKNIVDKAPSAELWEGQKDTDSLPPYNILDSLLKLYLERDLMSKEEIEKATNDIEVMSLKDIKHILKMTDKAEFKRRQAAPVLRVHKRAFGFGRNLPIAQKYEVNYENVL